MSLINPFYDDLTNLEFNIVYHTTRLDKPLDFHFHNSYEIYLCLTEQMDYLVNTQIYHLTIGDLLIFNSNDIHKSIPPTQGDYLRNLVLFTPDFIEHFSSSQTDLLKHFHTHSSDFNHRIHLNKKELHDFVALLNNANNTLLSDTYGNDIHQKITLANILLFINKRFDSNQSYAHDSITYAHDVNGLLVYIHTNFNQTISLDGLAKRFGLNKNQLNRNFKAFTGHTINQYLINYRILIAKHYLEQGETVSITAEKVGFNNLSHFIRTFHHIVGVSPKQFTIQQQ